MRLPVIQLARLALFLYGGVLMVWGLLPLIQGQASFGFPFLVYFESFFPGVLFLALGFFSLGYPRTAFLFGAINALFLLIWHFAAMHPGGILLMGICLGSQLWGLQAVRADESKPDPPDDVLDGDW